MRLSKGNCIRTQLLCVLRGVLVVLRVGDAQPLQVCISPGDQVCICSLGAHSTKNHLQQKLKMRTGHPWHKARGTHRSSRSQVGQGDGVPSFGAGPLSLSFSRTVSGATDQSSLEAEDKTSTLDAASKPTHSIAPGETKAAGFHAHKPDSSLLAGPLKTHHRHRKPLPPQERWQRSPEYELYRERSRSVPPPWSLALLAGLKRLTSAA